MSFCTFSSEVIKDDYIRVDNAFINSFMLDCQPDCLRAYLWGLYKCNTPTAIDNTLAGFSRALNLSEEDVISCFKYWEQFNVVQILNTDPLQIKYLPIKGASAHLKKFNKDKYKKFNLALQELLCGRMITPTEYNEFYYTMESLHMDNDAMLKIVEYCIGQKGENVGYSYILTIAKNWAYQGILTLEDVQARLDEQLKSTGDIKLVLKALGIKRNATDDEFQRYLVWTRTYDIPVENIIAVAKRVNGKMGAFNKLNNFMEKCYTLKLQSVKEIDDYFDNEQNLFDLAKDVCKNLGVRYERLDTVVDNYIIGWQSMGFDKEALIKLSNYCHATNIRTLQGMNAHINNLFKLGVVTSEAIDNHLAELTKDDDKLQNILNLLGLVRYVNTTDRQLLKIWQYDWNMPMELIEYACTLCEGKYLPMQYLNKLLSTYHNAKITTIEEASKIQLPEQKTASAPSTKKANKREYSKKQLETLFDDITEVEV